MGNRSVATGGGCAQNPGLKMQLVFMNYFVF